MHSTPKEQLTFIAELLRRLGCFWGFWIALYFASNLLILGVGAYDLVTRRRLHPAYVIGVAWVLANQMTAMVLYRAPFWLASSKKLIALWL